MNQRSLDEIIAGVVDRCRESGVTGEDGIMAEILRDPDMAIVLDGYEMHDRSGHLEDVMKRDIRRKLAALLEAEREA